jgi:serine/threonine-protein kinase
VLLTALAVLVVMALAGGAVYLLGTRTVSGAAPDPVGRSTVGPTSAQEIPAAPGPAASAASSGTQAPLDRLDALVAADRAAAESLVGRWVPQLSSKQVGTVDGGVTYDEAAILTEVEALKARFPHAVVIRSDDFTSFRRPGFWVTVVAAPSPSADGANSWCVDNGFARDQCFAKRLSHTDGPQGNTVPR